MRAKSDKVQLSFNAGEYSPFLDSRVDIDKASSAARTMRNFLAEVGGTARRRPGLRFVLATTQGLPDGSSGSSGEGLTNYVEFPFWQFIHWRADGDNPNTAYGLRYRGIVRVWESGTIQMVGELRFVDGTPSTALTELSYKVWFGETGQEGSLQTVATIPTASPGTWHEVNWAARPGALEHCEMFYGGIPELVDDPQQRVELWQYPDGMVMPSDPPHVWGGSAGGIGVTACGITRGGNDVDFEWAISLAPFTTQHYIATSEMSTVAPMEDYPVDNNTVHLNASTLFGPLGGTGTTTIPDSETIGLRIRAWTANTNVNTGTFDCGPWLRLEYAPSVQQGVDPVP